MSHPSLLPLLAVEVDLLSALIKQSQQQHRSQPFLCRAMAVRRLGRLLGRSQRLDLVEKLVGALFAAAQATRRYIDLHYFLPLHVLLLSIYARLFSLCTNFSRSLPPRPSNQSPILLSEDLSPFMVTDGKGLPQSERAPKVDVADSRYALPTPKKPPRPKRKDVMDDIFGF